MMGDERSCKDKCGDPEGLVQASRADWNGRCAYTGGSIEYAPVPGSVSSGIVGPDYWLNSTIATTAPMRQDGMESAMVVQT